MGAEQDTNHEEGGSLADPETLITNEFSPAELDRLRTLGHRNDLESAWVIKRVLEKIGK